MTNVRTLLEFAGADTAPARLAEAALVLIDMQNEYLDGPVAVTGAAAAVVAARRLLDRARRARAPVLHVVHRGRAGGLFDPDAPRGRIIDALGPADGEQVISKDLPNAFAGTDLADALAATGRREIVLAGFMTHMCVSSTARAALDLGFHVTVVADACATRDLPDGQGGTVRAADLNRVALVELSDRFAVIAPDAGALG